MAGCGDPAALDSTGHPQESKQPTTYHVHTVRKSTPSTLEKVF